jgi:hypothetical protein
VEFPTNLREKRLVGEYIRRKYRLTLKRPLEEKYWDLAKRIFVDCIYIENVKLMTPCILNMLVYKLYSDHNRTSMLNLLTV